MPYKSQAQAGFMHIHHPGIAARWDKEYGKTGPLPQHVAKKRAGNAKAAKRRVRKKARG